MGVILGGPKAWKVYRKGDIGIAFHWINDEPAMCLFPTVKKEGAGAYVIPLESAHRYATRRGGPTPYLLRSCVKAAQVMGMDVQRATLHRIADAILDGLEDLVKMPPKPQALEAKPVAAAEIQLFSGGTKIVDTALMVPAVATPQ